MNSNESTGVQASDHTSPFVESLLQQMALRSPTDELDAAIGRLVTADEAKGTRAAGVRFGWPAIFSTAAVAMIAGVWVGSFFLPESGKASDSMLAVGDPIENDAGLLTSVSFNVQAFNLLHGHSEKAEFGNCRQCHSLASFEDDTLSEVFEGWFYGDGNFFEVHPGGIDDCSKCHAMKVAKRNEVANESQDDFSKLVRCSQCHKVDANGFGGFKTDWRHTGSRSEG